MNMKYFFLIESIFGVVGVCVGEVHLLWITGICLILATAIHLDDMKQKRENDKIQ